MQTPTARSTIFTTLFLALLLTTTTFALPHPSHLQRQSNQKAIILALPQPHTRILSSTGTTINQTPSCGEPGTLAYTLTSTPSTTLPGSPFAGIPTAPECASHCLSATACLSFSYNQINGSCSLFRDGLSEMSVQKRGGAVFWWDRVCFERSGDAVGMGDEREGGVDVELMKEKTKAVGAEINDVEMKEAEAETKARPSQAQHAATILASRIARGRASSRIVHDFNVDAAIDDAIADVIASPAHDDNSNNPTHINDNDHAASPVKQSHANEDEAPLASLLKSSLLSAPAPTPKAWPYGVGALPADDADAKRAWTWEGKGQANLGNRRARRSLH